MIRIQLNGSSHSVPKDCPIAELLVRTGAPKGPCAVEVNRTVVPHREHESYHLRDGDVVEIVTLVGGG